MLMSCCVARMAWLPRPTQGFPFCARYAHSAVCAVDGTIIYIFGGSNGNETFNDLYTVDTGTFELVFLISSS